MKCNREREFELLVEASASMTESLGQRRAGLVRHLTTCRLDGTIDLQLVL